MTKVYHPVCHLINGERLYYILVRMRSSVLEAKQLIGTCMEQAGLEDSYCGYVTFGTSDLLIRVWAHEDKFKELHELLDRQKRLIEASSVYVIDSMSTWYQRDLEKRDAWPMAQAQSKYDDMMQQKIPRVYSCDLPADPRGTKKYFMFVEKPYTTQSTLFEEMKRLIEEDERSGQSKKYFKGIDRMSLYSYQAKNYQGVLIKGQATSLKTVYKSIAQISNDLEVKTETYICCDRIKESDDLNKALDIPLDRMQKNSIYNLVKSHDCYKDRFCNTKGAMVMYDTFCERSIPLFYLLFHYDDDWWEITEEVRKIFRWTVFQKDDTLMDFVRGQYVKYEAFFRNQLEKFLGLIADEEDDWIGWTRRVLVREAKDVGVDKNKVHTLVNRLNREHKEKTGEERERKILCYGDIVKYLGKLKGLGALSRAENMAIEELITAIDGCRDDRNKVMHGEVESLFAFDEEGKKWVWESYLLHLMYLMLVVHKHRATYEKFVSNLLECKNNRRG